MGECSDKYYYNHASSFLAPSLYRMTLFRLSCFYSHPKVQVYLIEVADVCSSASKREMYTRTVTVARDSTRSVPFIIIPMEHGKFPITVKASVGDKQIDDGVTKMLRVVVSQRAMAFFWWHSHQIDWLCQWLCHWHSHSQ